MFHRTEVIGNVGKDTEMRYLPNGTAVAAFSVAANEQFKNSSGEQVKRTVWYRVSVFGKLAEVCNRFVKRGMLVYVSGRLAADPATGGPRIWNKNDGTPSSSFEVTAQEVKFLSRLQTEQAEVSEELEPTF